MKNPTFIPIVKPYLPPICKYQNYISNVFERNWLTNNGPLVQLLEQRLSKYLGVEHLLLVANGTLALQVAYNALNIQNRVLTTSFSFAATASSLCWQNIEPIFVDINKKSLNIDIDTIDAELAKNATAILGVHVFGNPCVVSTIESFAQKNNLKVIYDAAHAFASNYKGKSVLNYGDASTLSFHATKIFHCVEGGAIIFKNKKDYELAKQMINFGFNHENMPTAIGINAKMSEMHAAMGLSVLDDIDHITEKRKLLMARYTELLSHVNEVSFQQWNDAGECNGAYMPILLENEAQLLRLMEFLTNKKIQTRRYFYPSLSQVDVYGEQGETPISNDVAMRVLCLPLYTDLGLTEVDYICEQIKLELQCTLSSRVNAK